MSSQEITTVKVESLYFVVRAIDKKKGGETWVGASIFYPESLRGNKVLAVFSPIIIKLLRTSCGKLKAGNLMQIKNQTYRVQFISDHRNVYNLNLKGKEIPAELEMLYMSDPFNLNENKSTCYVKHQYQADASHFAQKDIMNKYLDFNDHINYYKIDQKRKQKKLRKNKKRKFDEIVEENKYSESAPKQRKLMQTEQENESTSNYTEFKPNNTTNEVNNETMNKTENKDEDVEILSDNDAQYDSDKNIANELELRQNHLFVPSKIMRNPDGLLRFEGNDIIRMIYDSEEDNEQEEEQTNATRDFNDEWMRTTGDNAFGNLLLNGVDEEEEDSKWTISKCGKYWIPNTHNC